MMLVDTSVWIELLNEGLGSRVSEQDLLSFVTCGPVVQEVLQGLRRDPASDAFRESLLALPLLSDPLPIASFLAAAEIYRRGGGRKATRSAPPPIALSPPSRLTTTCLSGTRTGTLRPSRGIPASAVPASAPGASCSSPQPEQHGDSSPAWRSLRPA